MDFQSSRLITSMSLVCCVLASLLSYIVTLVTQYDLVSWNTASVQYHSQIRQWLLIFSEVDTLEIISAPD